MEETQSGTDLLRRITLPLGVVVAVVVVASWYVTWASSDLMMAVMDPMGFGVTDLALFFAILVVMMVAMMLPSALPMTVAFRGFTRLRYGRPTRPADDLATALFVTPYFVVWGGFSLLAVLGLVVLQVSMPLTGALAYAPAVVLLAAGAWQVTRTKEVCLTYCQSPMGFVMHHWRSGRAGAFRMGLRHSAYCIGCCWLFMLVLFVAGAMSLLWMAGLSVAIFVEKLGVRPVPVTRGIGAILFGFGLLVAAQAYLSG